jgi:hypothetical protein
MAPQALASALIGAKIGGMPTLTRRRSRDHDQECWLIYYGDIGANAPGPYGNKKRGTPAVAILEMVS